MTIFTPWHQCCSDAVGCAVQAKDMAIEDALYTLDKALQQGVIDLEFYLKQVCCASMSQVEPWIPPITLHWWSSG